MAPVLAASVLFAAAIAGSPPFAEAKGYYGAYPPYTSPTPVDVTDCILEIDPRACVDHALPSYPNAPERYLNEPRFRQHQPALELINAHHAYAKGLRGYGVRIGVEDSGMDVRGALGQGSYDLVGRLKYVTGEPITFWSPIFPTLLVSQPFLAFRPSAHSPGSSAFAKCGYPGACQVFQVNALTPDDITRAAFRIVQLLGYPDRDGVWFIHDLSAPVPQESWYEIPSLDRVGHGTEVASTAAGYRYGVAPGATVVPMHGNFLGYDRSRDPWRAQALADDIAGGLQWFQSYLSSLSYAERRAWDAESAEAIASYYSNFDILNRSFGSSCDTCVPGDSDYYEWINGALDHIGERAGEWPKSWEALTQSKTPDAKKTIVVYAAGNESAPYPSPGALLPWKHLELRGHHLAAVAIDPRTGVLAGYSNRCGNRLPPNWLASRDGRHYCLAAPGNVNAATPSGDPNSGSEPWSRTRGTSFAAPMVSGALALMMEHFRGQLGNREVALRAVNTANNRGIYSDAQTYGAGLLDLRAALSPVGTPYFSTSAYSAPVAASLLVVPAAYGDLGARVQAIEIAGFDELNAPFFYDLGDFVGSVAFRANPIPSFGGSSSFADTAPELALPFALASLPLSGTEMSDGFPGSFRLVGGDGRVGGLGQVTPDLRLGVVADSRGHMGGTTGGVFGAAAPSLVSWATFGRSRDLGGLGTLTGSVTLATSRPEHAPGSMFTTGGGLLSAWSLAFSPKDSGHRFTVSQPLRAETGTGNLRFASGRTPDGRRTYEEHTVSLVPEARELDLAWRHERRLGVGRLLLSAGGAWNANHTRGRTEGWMGARWRVTW